ncbi:hypothetical protein CsatB_028108 [Cannabis sativa]
MATDNHNAKAMEMEEDGPRSRDTPKGTPKASSSNHSYGDSFTLHCITKGQDIVSIMNSFVLNYPPNSLLTVLSANGTVSIVDIINCDDYTKYHRVLVLLINLETGEVFGGVVQRLVASTTIKMFVGSFKREIGMSFDGASSSSPSPSIGEVLAELVSNDTPVEDYDKITHQRSI